MQREMDLTLPVEVEETVESGNAEELMAQLDLEGEDIVSEIMGQIDTELVVPEVPLLGRGSKIPNTSYQILEKEGIDFDEAAWAYAAYICLCFDPNAEDNCYGRDSYTVMEVSASGKINGNVSGRRSLGDATKVYYSRLMAKGVK